MELTARERAILDFEREWWMLPGPKDTAIRARFKMSPSSYYRAVSGLIEHPGALRYDPLTAKRLRKQRDERRRVRIEGRRADPNTQ
ncbi:MAG: hypothetical protein JWL83_782 [Actinomycetia bacterium]|nr:hypothetical protein [Actinomycetes bacterium]